MTDLLTKLEALANELCEQTDREDSYGNGYRDGQWDAGIALSRLIEEEEMRKESNIDTDGQKGGLALALGLTEKGEPIMQKAAIARRGRFPYKDWP